MQPLFIGTYEHTLDDKGRVSVPGRFREQLAGLAGAATNGLPLVVTKNFDPGCRCLFAFSPAEWQAFAEKLDSASQADPNVLRLQRLVLASAAECPVDKAGRILLPPPLRDYAELRKDLIWAGTGRRIEIWDKALWADEDQRNRDGRGDLSQALLARGL
jgi:MraZ protein